ncbi:uncharacterized protein LOC127264534 [Andrographis paniculata]|uniref:uncharacterized protein LOC127264534 n=1 Tax=Andrographis paniculata TaxID=175694 RepID=UPI0021E7C592|nr:uncharacterized protein LOC127264534 [Andrographis paniculata]
MGSLMAGWDSPASKSNPNEAELRRNKSLTRDEIEAFWKLKKLKEEEHLKDISLLSPRTQKIIFEEAVKRTAQPGIEKELLEADTETSLEKLILKNGWWISSTSAFLNEPPVIAPEGTANKYTAQFHVAQPPSPAPGRGGAGINA